VGLNLIPDKRTVFNLDAEGRKCYYSRSAAGCSIGSDDEIPNFYASFVSGFDGVDFKKTR
tara:strand:+ start:57 stop:236 length:180 start_codon:yes stop_codon:yes gene_type:complete